MPLQITNQYWIVNNTNPTTQVYAGPAGAFVANTNATFESWLNANDGRADGASIGVQVIGTSSHGGLIQVQVNAALPSWVATGIVVNFVGNNSGAAGAAAITLIDSTHFDIQGSTFGVVDTSGTVWSATPIDTAANLQQVLNQAGLSLLVVANNFYSFNRISTGVNVTLSNPMTIITEIDPTAGGVSITLPPMNQPNSVPLGIPFAIINSTISTTADFTLKLNDGSVFATIEAGTTYWFQLSNNASVNGTIQLVGVMPGPTTPIMPVIHGGTGRSNLNPAHSVLIGEALAGVNTAAPGTSGNLLISQGSSADPSFNAMSGDATITNTGAITLASTITAGGPTGDATHVPQITYDAKGRLTTVSSVAITGTPPGGSAGGDLGGTYPNPTVTAIEAAASMKGGLIATEIAAPSAPGSGLSEIYVDSTSHNIASKNHAGTVNHGVQTQAGATHKFMQSIADDGSSVITQPASTDLSDLPIPISSGGTGVAAGPIPTLLAGMSAISNYLTSPVTLTTISTYYDGPSVAQGTSGTWWVAGQVAVQDTAGGAQINAKLWDGTTVIALATVQTQGASQVDTVSLSGFITSPAGNLRISCLNNTRGTTGQISNSVFVTNKDSSIFAIRIG